MAEPSQWAVDVEFMVTRIGITAAMLAAVLWFHSHDFRDFKKDTSWKLERSIRNERAIMQKLAIPIVLDGDMPSDKK